MLLVNLLTDMLPAMTIACVFSTRRSPEELLHEGPEASLGGALATQIALRARQPRLLGRQAPGC